jgi:hypothetical protein
MLDACWWQRFRPPAGIPARPERRRDISGHRPDARAENSAKQGKQLVGETARKLLNHARRPHGFGRATETDGRSPEGSETHPPDGRRPRGHPAQRGRTSGFAEKQQSQGALLLLVVAVAQRGSVRTPRPYPGMVTSWHAASPAVNDHAGDDPPDRLVEHRQAIVMILPRDKQLAA